MVVKFEEKKIIVDKELSELDIFTIDFLQFASIPYVLVSGYVSILLGRSRGSENIDILIPRLKKEQFFDSVNSLYKNGFYCLQTDDKDDMFELMESQAIRFARKDTVIPNMEVKYIQTPIQQHAFDEKIIVIIGEEKLYISPLELQIAYKEEVLCSPKDIEDAKHLRIVAKGKIDEERIRYYKKELE